MNRLLLLLCCACLGVVAPTAIAAPVPKSPSISGSSHILIAAETGKVLAAENADERMPPASLTKIMTAYVVYQALADGSITLDDEVTVSEESWRMGGSQMFLEVNPSSSCSTVSWCSPVTMRRCRWPSMWPVARPPSSSK